eukprot:15442079-Alexandrium_andersonii.AAC.1
MGDAEGPSSVPAPSWAGGGLNPFDVLNVPYNATDPEITRAYRRLALLHHPDKVPGDEEAATRFLWLQQAKESLLSPHFRALREAHRQAPAGEADTPLSRALARAREQAQRLSPGELLLVGTLHRNAHENVVVEASAARSSVAAPAAQTSATSAGAEPRDAP